MPPPSALFRQPGEPATAAAELDPRPGVGTDSHTGKPDRDEPAKLHTRLRHHDGDLGKHHEQAPPLLTGSRCTQSGTKPV